MTEALWWNGPSRCTWGCLFVRPTDVVLLSGVGAVVSCAPLCRGSGTRGHVRRCAAGRGLGVICAAVPLSLCRGLGARGVKYLAILGFLGARGAKYVGCWPTCWLLLRLLTSTRCPRRRETWRFRVCYPPPAPACRQLQLEKA